MGPHIFRREDVRSLARRTAWRNSCRSAQVL